LGTALVRDLARGERDQVVRRDGKSSRKRGRCAVVADGPAIGTGEDARVPVVRIAEITTVPGECDSLVHSLIQVFVRPCGIGVAHIVQYGDRELGVVARGARCGEAQDIRRRGAVRRGNLVIVCGIRLQTLNLDFVKELAALRYCRYQGTCWGTVVSVPRGCMSARGVLL